MIRNDRSDPALARDPRDRKPALSKDRFQQIVPNEVTDEEGYGRGFRVGTNEAIVIMGKTPPQVKYFSFAAFVSSTLLEGNPLPPQGATLIPGTHLHTVVSGDRRMVFYCVGDTLNNLTLKTPATVADPNAPVFEQSFIIIFTSDAITEKEVKRIAASVGWPIDSINTKVLPADIARLGVDRDADTFSIGHRLAFDGVPEHDRRAEQYVNAPTYRVFRLTPPKDIPQKSLALPPLRVRGTGKTELNLWPAVRQLRQAILQAHSKPELRRSPEMTHLCSPKVDQARNAIDD